MYELDWNSERLVALPERALWWPARSTLLIADMHLGKAATFRAAGVPVPEAGTAADLARLSALIHRFTPDRLVILGDLIHARTGRSPETMLAFSDWRSTHAALDILLIRGNHDTSAGDPPSNWSLRIASEPHHDHGDDTFAFAHYPEAAHNSPLPAFCGHIHPGIRLSGSCTSIRCPGFIFGTHTAILPAFGSFTGMAIVDPAPSDRILAVGPGEIVEIKPQAPSRGPVTRDTRSGPTRTRRTSRSRR